MYKSIKPLYTLLAIVVVAVLAALVGYARPIEHFRISRAEIAKQQFSKNGARISND